MFQHISEKTFLKGWSSYKGNVKFVIIFYLLLYFNPKQLFKSISVTNITNIHYLDNLDSQFILCKQKQSWTQVSINQSHGRPVICYCHRRTFCTGPLLAVSLHRPAVLSHRSLSHATILWLVFLTKHYKGDAMGRASCTHVEEEKFIHSFYEKTWRKESTWKTLLQIGFIWFRI